MSKSLKEAPFRLEALTVGQILDMTVRLIRRNIRGISLVALVLLIPVIINAVYLWSTRDISIRFGSDDQINIYILRSLTTGLIFFLTMPVVALIVSRFTIVSAIRVPGEPYESSWQALVQVVLARWAGLYWVSFVYGLALAIPMILGFLGIANIAADFDVENQLWSWQSLTTISALAVLYFFVLIYFFLGFSFFPAVMAAEQKGAYDAFVKSWQLVKGERIGILLGSIVGLFVLIGLYTGLSLLIEELDLPLFLIRGLQYVAWETFPLFYFPYQIIFLTVCYLNQRVRIDGLDLEWMLLQTEKKESS